MVTVVYKNGSEIWGPSVFKWHGVRFRSVIWM